MKTDIRHKGTAFYPAALAATVAIATPVLAHGTRPATAVSAPSVSIKRGNSGATHLASLQTLAGTGASDVARLRLVASETTTSPGATSTSVGTATVDTTTVGTTTAATVETEPERDRGFYLSLSGGTQNRGMAVEKDGNARLTFDRGTVFSAAVGYRYRNFRVEGEYARWKNDINNTILIAQGVNENGSGDVGLRSLMLNVYYDFRLRNPRILPYVGFGYGQYKSRINDLTSPSLELFEDLGFFPPGSFPFDATSDNFSAYQLKAGVGYQVNRRSIVSLGYRYFRGQRLKFTGTPFGAIEPSGSHNHVFEIGYRYNF